MSCSNASQTLNSLLITKKDKSHHVFFRDFTKLMVSTTKKKHKKHHCMSSLQSFITEEVLSQNKKCLLINGCQAVIYESGTIKLANCNPEFFLKHINSSEGEYTIKHQEHFLTL